MLDIGQAAGTFLRPPKPLSSTCGIGRIVHPFEKFQTKASRVSASRPGMMAYHLQILLLMSYGIIMVATTTTSTMTITEFAVVALLQGLRQKRQWQVF